MARRTRRAAPPPPKVLSTPASTCVVACYAIEGVAYVHHPLHAEGCTIVLVNAARAVAHVRQSGSYSGWYCSDEVPPGDWRVLGWLPRDGSQRHGAFDLADPNLADLAMLPVPNHQPDLPASSRPNLCLRDIDIVPWDENGKPEF